MSCQLVMEHSTEIRLQPPISCAATHIPLPDIYPSSFIYFNSTIQSTTTLSLILTLNYSQNVLTFVDSWLDKLITWSLASDNSLFNRRTSFACRSSAEPYRELPPDSKDAALPCTKKKRIWNVTHSNIHPGTLHGKQRSAYLRHSSWDMLNDDSLAFDPEQHV